MRSKPAGYLRIFEVRVRWPSVISRALKKFGLFYQDMAQSVTFRLSSLQYRPFLITGHGFTWHSLSWRR